MGWPAAACGVCCGDKSPLNRGACRRQSTHPASCTPAAPRPGAAGPGVHFCTLYSILCTLYSAGPGVHLCRGPHLHRHVGCPGGHTSCKPVSICNRPRHSQGQGRIKNKNQDKREPAILHPCLPRRSTFLILKTRTSGAQGLHPCLPRRQHAPLPEGPVGAGGARRPPAPRPQRRHHRPRPRPGSCPAGGLSAGAAGACGSGL